MSLALTSGMLAEVSWAIDCLAILTHDPVSNHVDVNKHSRLFESLINLFVLCMDELMKTMTERNRWKKNEKVWDVVDEAGVSDIIKKEKENEAMEVMLAELDGEIEINKSESKPTKDEDATDDEDSDTYRKIYPSCTSTYNAFFGTDVKKSHPCIFSLKGELEDKNVFYKPVLQHNYNFKKVKREHSSGKKETIDHIKLEFEETILPHSSTSHPTAQICSDDYSHQTFSRILLDKLSSASEVGYDVEEKGEDLFNNVQEKSDLLARRCICISNILRNLALQAVNEREMATHLKFISLASHFLLFDHKHLVKKDTDCLEDSLADPDLSSEVDRLWWNSMSSNIRSNFIVALSSIATHINLSSLPGDVCMELCDGLLHWAICQTSEALDPHSGLSISIQRVVFETLTKLCIQRENADFLLATPPFSRFVKFVQYIVEVLYQEESEVERDILLGLLSRLVEGDSRVARIMVIDGTAPLILVGLIENYMNTLMMKEQSRYMEGFNVSEQFLEISAYTACKASEIFRFLTSRSENVSSLSKFKKHILDISTNDLQDDTITANICHVIATLC